MYRQEQLKELLDGRRILIAGYGREGRSSHDLITRLCPSASVTVADGNENIRREASNGFDMIIKSPGIPMSVFDGCCKRDSITSQSDIFLQVYGDQTVGVTGTKGKSTTSTLIHHVLVQSGRHSILAGNIGIPLFDIIPQMDSATTVVAELSCHQLESIHRGPHIAVLLNLFQEHLDHYRDYLDYQMAKMQIGLQQREDDYFFYSSDNSDLNARVTENRTALRSHVQPFNLDSALQSPLHDLQSPLAGNHNLTNTFVAWQVTSLLGVDGKQFASALASFKPLEHRMELVGTVDGVTYYNDSISTIPAACIAAVNALPDVATLIVGGFDRGIDYQPLADFLSGSHIRNIAFTGAAGRRVMSLMRPETINDRNILVEDDYTKIVAWCASVTPKGASCLLSPAAASYDAFKNFEQRGSVFKQLVRSTGDNNVR
ncbi:MAG: UDP-N-acetylmuramoyl-L-alanine--D-glutamate ligase [Bacteroidales bacterium]|nr:UDP-N-acetylmuramoyl-L-alanine--D-glutamate ligase [Bacteroidales bacterium]